MIKKFFILLISLLLTACAVGPDYVKPSVAVPHKFKEAPPPKGWKIAQPRDDFNRGNWWEIFHDQTLNQLEEQLNHCNQTIATADANFRQAWALVDEARASFFPTGSLNASITRQSQGSGSFVSNSSTIPGSASGSSSTTTGTISSTSTGSTGPNNSHSLSFAASWEPDIWGTIRRTVEASVGGAQASQALLAATRLSSQGSLAQIYFQLRALDMDQKILDETVNGYKKSYQLTQNRYHSGVAAYADVIQAKTQLESAQSLAINNHIGRAQFEHAIAVLIGRPPADFSISPCPLRQSPPLVPVSVPSTLLERRPDIAQAERLMMQANAQIGIAISAYYPTLNIFGSATYRHSGLFNNWFSIPDLGWSIGPQLAETLFDGGLRDATISAARMGYISSVASYRQVVLAAFQDVEDNLVSLTTLRKQFIVQNQAAKDAKTALQIMLNQYKAGLVDYTSVINAQVTAYNAEKSAADTRGLEMVSAVGLIKALGGGWC